MNRGSTLRAGAWISSLVVAFAIGHYTSKQDTQTVQAQTSVNLTQNETRADLDNRPNASASLSGSSEKDLPLSPTNSLGQFTFLSPTATKANMVADIARYNIPKARMHALLAVLNTLEADEYKNAIQGLEQSGMMDLRTTEYDMIYSAWAQDAPEEAIAYASKQFVNEAAKKAILQSWSTHAPEAALAWARDNYSSPDGDTANPWELSIVKGAVGTNLELASEIAFSMPYGSKGREEAASVILGYLNSVDPDQAFQWANQIQDEVFQSISLDILARKIVQTDPTNAYERVSALNYGSGLEYVAEELAHRRYLENPESVKEWVKTLPEAAVGNAANAIVQQNSGTDLIQTSEWLDEIIASNPDGYYQVAIESIVQKATLRDPQLAAEWIPDLDSKQAQNRYYQEVLSEWVEQDPVASLDWVQYHYKSLPESVLVRFFPEFVPKINAHNQDESDSASIL